MRKPDQESGPEDALSSYTKIMASTGQLLIFAALLLGVFSAFDLLFGQIFADSVWVISSATLSMLAVALTAIVIAGDRLPAFSNRCAAQIESWMNSCSAEIENWINGLSPSHLRTAVIVTAGLSLFLELVLIRWEAGLFVIFALYKNFTLLACFCGLGIGYAKARDRQLTLPAALPMILLLLAVFSFLRYGTGKFGNALFQVVPVREEVSVFFGFDPNASFLTFFMHSLPVYCLLALTFVLNTLVLLPVGQFCGRLMQRMEPLASYGYNLLGSAVGVSLLFLLSWMWAGPAMWFGLAAAGLAFFQLASRAARKIAFGFAIACALLAAWPMTPMIQTIYSPYQTIEKASQPNGLMSLLVSGSYYQKVFNLGPSNSNRETDPNLRQVIGYYELPFRTAKSVNRVAIVGAGSGNDIASALRNNAGHVDAVEIDPVIRSLGMDNHPEHPYEDPRVNSIINDARNFFRTTPAFYDAIVYGVLDSHTVVSHGANMRVDSFVYTKEGLRDAFDHLNTGGLLSVSFALQTPLMGEKIFHILKSLPGAGRPVAILTGYDSNNTTTFMISKGAEVQLPIAYMKTHQLTDITKSYMATSAKSLDLPTDDWPFFYLEKRMYPQTYLILLALVLGVAFFLVRGLLPAQAWQPSALSYFFLGGGFMLVETKAITELGLLFGNTWQVVGVTIIGVLVMAYLANIFAGRLTRQNLTWAFVGLFVILLVGYASAIQGSASTISLWQKILLVAVLVGPLFFSGMVFSTLLKGSQNISGAMAYNLMGAMLGGALEYNSMRLGFSSLYLIALGLYGLAWLTMQFKDAPLSWRQFENAMPAPQDETPSSYREKPGTGT